jgi:outer membrane immunogenic protein
LHKPNFSACRRYNSRQNQELAERREFGPSQSNGDFMINSRLVVSAVVAFSATIGSASAADLAARPYTKAPVYAAPPVAWTGCYIGGNVGGGWDRFNAGELAFAGAPTPFVDYGSNRGSSLVGGGQIGCDYQFAASWVIGIQGQAEFGTIHSSNEVAAFPGITADFKLRNIETLTGRLGYTVTPAVLAYVKGGAAWANASAAATIPSGLIGESADFTMTGYTVGGGLEWMFAPGWSVFGEYNYMDFGTKSVNFASTGLVPGFGPAGALADTNAIKLTTQTAVVGVNYKFNWGNAVAAKY